MRFFFQELAVSRPQAGAAEPENRDSEFPGFEIWFPKSALQFRELAFGFSVREACGPLIAVWVPFLRSGASIFRIGFLASGRTFLLHELAIPRPQAGAAEPGNRDSEFPDFKIRFPKSEPQFPKSALSFPGSESPRRGRGPGSELQGPRRGGRPCGMQVGDPGRPAVRFLRSGVSIPGTGFCSGAGRAQLDLWFGRIRLLRFGELLVRMTSSWSFSENLLREVASLPRVEHILLSRIGGPAPARGRGGAR